MTLHTRMTWLFMVVVCAMTVAGCGSTSTGRASSDAVIKTAHRFAGPHAKISADGLLVRNASSDKVHIMWMFVACKHGGGCELIAPDGAGYPDLQAFVDDTKLLEPGATVSGNANIASPGKPEHTVTLTKHAISHRAWYLGGGGALLVVIVAAWLAVRRRCGGGRESNPPGTDTAPLRF